MPTLRVLGLAGALCATGCSSSGGTGSGGSGTSRAGSDATSTGAAPTTVSGTSTTASRSVGSGSGGSGPVNADTLDSNRDRLLQTYLEYLLAFATQPQSNGLSSSNVSSVCDVWSQLDPSSQAVFLTVTERLQASVLGVDPSSMLWHVTKVYRVTGGQGATQLDPGSCGGGEQNRMIMSEDTALFAAQLAANTHQGALQGNGKPDIADAPPNGTFWRDSHDLGGSHAPFDISNETEQGAPRGQIQYFSDPTSALANTALGRQDLMTLVDPYALEMDQDYNCPHDSNPLCTYTTYGALCFPQMAELGTQLFAAAYGDYEPQWKPTGCP